MDDRLPTHDRDAAADAGLLHLIQQGDEGALGALYDARGRLIYSLVLSVVHNESDAEEVTQEVFLRVWEKAATFNSARGSVLAWMVTIARRMAIDRTRSKGYKGAARSVALDAVAQTAGEAGVGTEVTVQAREVVDAIGRLDRNLQEVLRLSYFEGLSHGKIAERLGAPLGTVKSRIREAVSQLRRLLGIVTE